MPRETPPVRLFQRWTGQQALEAAECLREANRREAAWTTAMRWLFMASSLNGQRRGQVPGKAGIGRTFQHVGLGVVG